VIKLKQLLKEALEAKKEKRNKLYHQTKPVQFKKPPEGPDVDEDPKAEKEQKDVNKRMEDQAEVANPSSVETFKKLRDNFQAAVNEVNGVVSEEESDAAEKAHQLKLVAKPYGNWADPSSGETVAKTVKGQLVKLDKGDQAQSDDPMDTEPTPDVHTTSPEPNDPLKKPTPKSVPKSFEANPEMQAQKAKAISIVDKCGSAKAAAERIKTPALRDKFAKLVDTTASDLALWAEGSLEDTNAEDIIAFANDNDRISDHFNIPSEEGFDFQPSSETRLAKADMIFSTLKAAKSGQPVAGNKEVEQAVKYWEARMEMDVDDHTRGKDDYYNSPENDHKRGQRARNLRRDGGY
jgi:hypothetical protein